MATQIDPLGTRSFKETRSWRRRDASNTLARQARSGTVDGTHTESPEPSPTPTPTLPLSSLSLSPSPRSSPPLSRPGSGRRSRSSTVGSSPVPSISSVVSASDAPIPSIFEYPCSSDSTGTDVRPRPATAYAFTGASRSTATPTFKSTSETDHAETLPDDANVYATSLDSSPQDSQPDCIEATASSSVSGKNIDNSRSQPTQQPNLNLNSNSNSTSNTISNINQNNGALLSLKRRRALSDVDGPNTGVLCCKKRRLRRFLITSRLSQPFSQPASHILNRESVASGDKRFLKLAAIMNARRIRSPHATAVNSATAVPPPPEAVWRAAMANRFRKRIISDTAMGRSIAGAPVQLMNSARLVLVPVSMAASMAAVRINASANANSAYMPGQKVPSMNASENQISANIGRNANISITPRRARSHSTSPRLRPVKDKDSRYKPAEEDYPRPSLVDDDSDCAFPTSEHGSRYEDDDYDDEDDRPDDEVYADFSVLFGSSGDDTDWGGNEEGLDDYMDELDGIAHLPR